MGTIQPFPSAADLRIIRDTPSALHPVAKPASVARSTSWQEVRHTCECGRRHRIVIENGHVVVSESEPGA